MTSKDDQVSPFCDECGHHEKEHWNDHEPDACVGADETCHCLSFKSKALDELWKRREASRTQTDERLSDEFKSAKIRVAGFNELTPEQGRALYAAYVKRGLEIDRLRSAQAPADNSLVKQMWEADQKVYRAQEIQLKETRRLLDWIAAACGTPDAAEGCRNILKRIRELKETTSPTAQTSSDKSEGDR